MSTVKAKLREDYQDIVNYVANKSAISYHKARLILTSYSNQLQRSLLKGYSIKLDGLIEVSFTSRKGKIINNNVHGLPEQVKLVSEETGYDEFEVEIAISSYLYRLRTLGKLGYQVNIKGIGYIIPNETEDSLEMVTRISPVVSKEKPELADFIIVDKKGNKHLTLLKKDELRFKITLAEDYVYPENLMTDNTLELEYIDI